MKALTLVLIPLISLNSWAADPWDPAYGYRREPWRQTPKTPLGDPLVLPRGTWDASAGGQQAPVSPSAGTSRSGLYERLRSEPGLGSVPMRGRENSEPPPGAEQRDYRFRGDGLVDKGYPHANNEYRYRPLTAQERDRSQTSPGWRPLTAPRQDSSLAATPYPDSWPHGWDQGPPPDAGVPVVPTNEPDNWFERNFRHRGDAGR